MTESFTDTPLLTERFDAALHHAARHHARQGIATRIYYRELAAR